jgi:hypothetical protein
MPENEGQARDPAQFKRGAVRASRASAIHHSVLPLPCTYMYIYIYIYIYMYSTTQPHAPCAEEGFQLFTTGFTFSTNTGYSCGFGDNGTQ